MPSFDEVMKLIKIFAPVTSLIPGVGPYVSIALPVIESVEKNFGPDSSNPLPGAAKKERALAQIADLINIYNTSVGANFNNSRIMGYISGLIDNAVGLANEVGAFKKG